jgi:hypothetical protein
MIRCNGYCSGRRAILATRTPVGATVHFAGHEKASCGALTSTAARETDSHLPSSLPFPHVTGNPRHWRSPRLTTTGPHGSTDMAESSNGNSGVSNVLRARQDCE